VNYWIVAAALAAACVAVGAICIRFRGQLKQRESEVQQLRIEIDGIRRENVDCRREIAALCRELEDEQCYSDRLNQDLDDQYNRLLEAEQRAERAEARRTDAEKEIYAGRMRAEQLQQQLRQAHDEQLAQEQLYQDIIRDRDKTIARLQEKGRKHRMKKKREALDHQITLDDLLSQEDVRVHE